MTRKDYTVLAGIFIKSYKSVGNAHDVNVMLEITMKGLSEAYDNFDREKFYNHIIAGLNVAA